MNKIKRLALSLIFITTLCAACNNKKPKDLIVKKWQVTDAKTSSGTALDEETVNRMKQLIFEFTADGKLILNGIPGQEKQGTYKISDDGKTLSTVSPQGEASDSEVKTLTDDKLVFTDKNSKMEITAEPKK